MLEEVPCCTVILAFKGPSCSCHVEGGQIGLQSKKAARKWPN